MKKIFVFIFVMLLIPSVLAINLEVEKQSSDEVKIYGLDNPVVFDLEITNLGQTDYFNFYNLLGFQMSPTEKILIKQDETKKIQLNVSMKDFNYKGNYIFEYFIKSQDNSEIEQKLAFKIIDLKDVFEIGSEEIDPESNTLNVFIKNKENFDFEEISVKFSSDFFYLEETFSLIPKGKKSFVIQLNKQDFKKLMAGFYTLNAEVIVEEEKVGLEGLIKFTEKDILTTSKKDYGILINTQIIEKINEGNVIINSETVLRKNILSRLFASVSPTPTFIDRQGMTIFYTWNEEINPGESFEIVVKTNWLLPFLVIFFVIVIVILIKESSNTNLILRKKVSFVNAKGGEFALKVSIFVNAKKYIEKVNIIDRLPPLVKLYEKFGREVPAKIDEKTKRITWNFEKLEQGETRVISYVVYSKIGVLGKFALPRVTAIYERNGKISESSSNKAFFITEPRKKDSGD